MIEYETVGHLMIKIAFCGDDCSFCPRYNATLNQNEHKLREIAILWKTIGWRENIDPPETLVCYGCDTFNGTCEYNVRECCIEKNNENCGKCESYPCDRIENAFEITRNNVEKYKDILSKEDYEIFVKAFFSKKDNLDKVNCEFKNRKE
jgi:hypothetical protein